jgi:hypothetical protein
MARRTSVIVALVVAGAVVVGTIAAIGGAQSSSRFTAKRLVGDFEVPAISTVARGTFEARLNGSTVNYKLTYSGLESDVRQAHIHFAQSSVNGGISVWLCETTTVPHPTVSLQAVTPDCGGPRAAVIEDSFDAAEVIGPGVQGISAGEFAALLGAMRDGLTYANVHSQTFGGGEIRAQIKRGGGGDDDDDDD